VSQVDLHIHSTASDGRFSPPALVSKAAALGLTFIALADHDSVDGIAPALAAAKEFPPLRVIPAVEISTDLPEGEAHILGYFIDYTGGELRSALEHFRTSRERRAHGMIAKLHDMGVYIDWSRVRELAAGGSIGRPHIAQAMLEKGYIKSVQDAFNGYIEHGGPAYVEREKMTPAEAVALVVRTGGLPVLAHPFTVLDPEAMVMELKEAGLVGIEAYYKDYTSEEIGSLAGLAGKYGLIATGGSDYHGLDDSREVPLGGVEVPMEAAERLIALAQGAKTQNG
jgi:predicted metal-dependent phosphoesterase TrpH